MTKFKNSLFGLIGLCFFAVLPVAHAQNSGPDMQSSSSWHPGQRIQEIYSQLGLTDDQKKQLEANKQQHRARMGTLRQALKINRETLQQEIMKPQLDMSKIAEVHDRIKTLQFQMEDAKLNSILAVRTILTPDQFIKFVNLMHKHKQEHEE